MTAQNWRLPSSEDKKLKVLDKKHGEVMLNEYIWYEVGDITELSVEEIDAILKQCFVGPCSPESMQLFDSRHMGGTPMVLRLYGDVCALPSLMIRGRYCPLYQVGHIHKPETCINFYHRWEKQQA